MAWFAFHLHSAAMCVNDVLEDLGPQSSTPCLSTHDLVRNRRSRISEGMPGPVSITEMHTIPTSVTHSPRMVMRPPDATSDNALLITLQKTLNMRRLSA